MKPKLNKIVYTIYQDSITKSTVSYIGKDSFIINAWKDYGYDFGYEYYYKEYNKTWFTSFAKAKKQILDDYKENDCKCILKQFAEDYWSVVEDD